MQSSVARLAILIVTLVCFSHSATAQAKETKTGASAITGRVTLGAEPKPGVFISLTLAQPPLYGERNTLTGATTDADGRYRLNNLPAGNFNVLIFAPGFIAAETDSRYGQPGKQITLVEGETVENFDFSLTRGGVLTGRVTDAADKPVIGEQVALWLLNAQGVPQRRFASSTWMYETDDRGVYRIYGLAAGKYLVSAGVAEGGNPMIRNAGARNQYQLTYHPDANNAAHAKVLTVTPGSEITEVNIRLGDTVKGRDVAVRVVEAGTGRPVPDVMVTYGRVQQQGNYVAPSDYTARTDAQGRARFERLLPGRYAAFLANWRNDSDLYSEPTVFEVTESGLESVEVKVQRGVTLSGVVVVEGVKDPALLALVAQMSVSARPLQQGDNKLETPYNSDSKVNPDGSFTLRGLQSGRLQLWVYGDRREERLSLVRIERNGAPQPETLEAAAGENVTGVRLVLAYGTGVVRGQVQITGGAFPANLRMNVFARLVGGPPTGGNKFGEVDPRGRFVLENLVAGEYELTLNAYLRPAAPGAPSSPLPEVKQKITITEGGELQVVLPLDLTPKEKQQ